MSSVRCRVFVFKIIISNLIFIALFLNCNNSDPCIFEEKFTKNFTNRRITTEYIFMEVMRFQKEFQKESLKLFVILGLTILKNLRQLLIFLLMMSCQERFNQSRDRKHHFSSTNPFNFPCVFANLRLFKLPFHHQICTLIYSYIKSSGRFSNIKFITVAKNYVNGIFFNTELDIMVIVILVFTLNVLFIFLNLRFQ